MSHKETIDFREHGSTFYLHVISLLCMHAGHTYLLCPDARGKSPS